MDLAYTGWRHLVVVIMVGLIGLAARPTRGQSPDAAAGRAWAPEVQAALAAYRADDLATAAQISRQVLTQARDPAAQRDAAVVRAMTLLRMPARADRNEGRARLEQLGAEDPTLRDEPECNLAFGIALGALTETADALDALDRAVTGFAARGELARQAAALVALAETWAQHNEWEHTLPRFGVPRLPDRDAADQARRARIAAARAAAAILPGQAEAVDRIDAILAQYLLDCGDPDGTGRALLEQLSGRDAWNAAAADAAWRLAQHCETLDQWAEALALYERLRRDWHGEPARRAEERIADITRPQILLHAPAAVRNGEPLRPRLQVRGVPRVQLELRQVDAEAWLNSARTRRSEALLPESGSVRVARDVETNAEATYAWWDSALTGTELACSAESGAYVLLARGRDAAGREIVVKRLVTVSDLRVAACVGPHTAVLWAPASDEAGADEPVTAQFWMDQSFTPTDVRFEGDVARFALPAEAHVMRDKGWVCLVRRGTQLAVCRGRVPVPGAEGTPRIALLAAPPTPAVGASLYVAGLLFPGNEVGVPLPAGTAIDLEVRDALEAVQRQQRIDALAGAALAAEFPVTADLAAKHLRVLPRLVGQSVGNLFGRATVSIPPLELARFRVRVDMPTWLAADAAVLTGAVVGEYPWGTATSQAPVTCEFRARRLPDAGENSAPMTGAFAVRDGRLDLAGRMPFEVSRAEFGLPEGPLAITVTATVRSWDGREGVGKAEVLVAAQRRHAWLTVAPGDWTVGSEIRFNVGWFEPGGVAVARFPEVVVQHGGAPVARLPLQATAGGLVSAPWRPSAPGDYAAIATLAVVGDEPIPLQTTFRVGDAATAQPNTGTGVRLAAHFSRVDEDAVVRFTLTGEADCPLLVLLADSEPHAAWSVGKPGQAEHAGHFLLQREPALGLRTVLLAARPKGFEILAAPYVAADPERMLRLDLAVASPDAWPGTSAEVTARCAATPAPPPGTTLMARLIAAEDVGYENRRVATRDVDDTWADLGLSIVGSAGDTATVAKPDDLRPALEAGLGALWPALTEGVTLWTTSVELGEDAATTLSVPLPATPGLYKLIAMARTPAGTVATAQTLLDARRGVRLALDVPARLTLGDRSQVAVLVENGYAEPVHVQVRCTSDGGLHAETARVALEGHAAQPAPVNTAASVELPALGRAWLHVDVEAARAGVGEVQAEVTAREQRQTARTPYEVLPADEPPTEARLRIQRTIMLWVPPPGAEHVHTAAHPHWRWVPLESTARLVPGQSLKVVEELDVTAPEAELLWTQRVPPTCHPVTGAMTKPTQIGSPRPDVTDALVFDVPGLKPGRNRHEYYLVVVRPGACVLPAPQLQRGTEVLSSTVTPPELWLVAPAER